MNGEDESLRGLSFHFAHNRLSFFLEIQKGRSVHILLEYRNLNGRQVGR